MVPLVSFSIRMGFVGPASATFNGLLQLFGSAGADVAVGRVAGSNVGMINGSAVKVGKGVGLGVSVGGRGVAVGIAAWVMATTVHAAATAVLLTSAGAMVGVPCGPQAVNRTVNASKMGNIFFNIFSPFIYLFKKLVILLRLDLCKSLNSNPVIYPI
jgi:hypothetical protein